MAKDFQSVYRQAVRAIQDEHDFNRGRQLLVEALRIDPNNDEAWVWLSKTTKEPQKQLQCLERALAINPTNQQALRLKERLNPVTTASSPESRRTASLDVIPKSNIKAKAARQDKGKKLKTFGLNKKQRTEKMILIVLCGALAVGLLAGFFYLPRGDWTGTLLGIGALAPIAGALYYSYSILRSRGLQIALYEHGIERIYRRQSQFWRWEDFSGIRIEDQTLHYHYATVPVSEMQSYKCQLLVDGKPVLKINKDIDQAVELGKMLIEKTTPVFFERDHHTFQQDGSVQYGKIQVTPEGIRDGRTFTAWDEIRSWKVDQGYLILQTNNRRPVHIGVFNLINAGSLFMMVDKLSKKDF
jgi:tetratricopeptide (TPR) repeat protein